MEQPKMPSWPLSGRPSAPTLRLLLHELAVRRPPELVITVTLPRRRDEAFAFDDDE
jgi:hypothetical protein